MTASVKRNRWTEMWKIHIPGFDWQGNSIVGGDCFIDTLPNNMWNFTYPSTSIVSGMRKTFNGRVNIYKFGWFLWLYSRKWQHRITLVDFFLKEHQAKRKNDQKAPRYILQYFLFSNKHKETFHNEWVQCCFKWRWCEDSRITRMSPIITEEKFFIQIVIIQCNSNSKGWKTS